MSEHEACWVVVGDTPLDAEIVAAGVVRWRIGARFAVNGCGLVGRQSQKGRSTPVGESVDDLLEAHGVRWSTDKVLYQRYERAIRLQAQGET